MWQDGLALLIVVLALWALLRHLLPQRWLRVNTPASPERGCGGCALHSSCAKNRVDSGLAGAAATEPQP